MNAYSKILALAAAQANLIDSVTGIEFLIVGQTESHLSLIAECPRCQTGTIEHDLPISDMAAPWGPALCERCENDPVELTVHAAPAPKAHSLIPVPARPSSLSLVAPAPGSKLPAPKHQDQRPVYIPPPTPQCKHCGKYVAPDNSSGIIPHSCGDCRDARAVKSTTHTEDHRCKSCNESLEGYHISTVYCSGCSRGRSWLQQSAKNKQRARERLASRVCQRCQTKPLGAKAHSSTKYCPECKPLVAAEKQRDQTARYNAKKKIQYQQGGHHD